MTPEQNHRIAQIRAGEIPDGYKKLLNTNFIVPDDWSETRMNELFSRLTRRNTERNTNVLTISAQHGLINQEEFFSKTIASDDKSNYFLLRRGDFAYNKSYSAGYPFGAVKTLEKYESGIVSPLYICFERTAQNECADYYLQYFEGGCANKEIRSFAQEGARNHGLLNISTEDFFNMSLVLPPLAEQQKIARILCAQDRVIALRQKLLQEKQLQKKYLLRKLLSQDGGQFTLCGVTIDKRGWKKGILSDVAVGFDYGMNAAATDFDGENKYIRITDIDDESHKFTASDFVSPSGKPEKKFLVKDNDILFARTGASTGKSYLYSRDDGKLYFAGFLIRINVISANPYFIYSQTLTTKYQNWLKIMSVRSGQPGVNAEEYKNLPIVIPTLPEQHAIACVLSAADKELELLQKSIAQEKQKKKALMQLLLTGTVRVKT